MSALADLSDAEIADEIVRLRDELARRNNLLRDNASPAAKSLVTCRRSALAWMAQAEERLRAGAATDLPADDLPVIDEPRVPRRPPIGGDPMRPVNGERLPPGRYHP